MSPEAKVVFATVLSWIIMLTVVAIIIGGVIFLFESMILDTNFFTQMGIFDLIISLFQTSAGLGILAIGCLITGAFVLTTVLILLFRNGQKLLLQIITKMED